MVTFPNPAEATALLIVNPYNDLMSEGGERFEAAGQVAAAANLRRLIPVVRTGEILVVIAPHARWRAGDVEGVRVGANTALEGTACHAAELGCQVMPVTDAAVSVDAEGQRAAPEIDGPHHAHSILTTDELIRRLPR